MKSNRSANLNRSLDANPKLRVRTLLRLDDHWPATLSSDTWSYWLEQQDTAAAGAALMKLSQNHGTQILFDHLGARDLGGVAAQALGTNSDPAVKQRLRSLTTNDATKVVSARAKLALRLGQIQLPQSSVDDVGIEDQQ